MAFMFNPFTGNFDMTACDTKIAKIACEEAVKAIQSIVTTDKNALGNRNFFYDRMTCSWVEAGPQIVTDDDGVIQVNITDKDTK